MNDDNIPALLRECNKQIRNAAVESLAAAGLEELRPQDGQILWFLFEHPNASSADIQMVRRCAKSSVSESLSLLQDRGFIDYVVNDENRREKKIFLTEKGIKHQKAVNSVLSKLSSNLLDGISGKEREQFLETLLRITANAERRKHG